MLLFQIGELVKVAAEKVGEKLTSAVRRRPGSSLYDIKTKGHIPLECVTTAFVHGSVSDMLFSSIHRA